MTAPRLRFGVVPEVAIATIVLLAVALVAHCLAGCGSATSQHRALNTLAATADPSYALAVEACDEAEGVIIERQGTTLEQDEQSMADIRRACDRVFGAFEALRVAHVLARAAVDGGGQALKDEALRRLGDAWAALQAMAPEIGRL